MNSNIKLTGYVYGEKKEIPLIQMAFVPPKLNPNRNLFFF